MAGTFFPWWGKRSRHSRRMRNPQLCVTVKRPIADKALQWRHDERNEVSDHHHCDCLLNRLFSRRSKKTSKLHVTSLCAGNSPVIDEFPAQRASNAENASIWSRHHVYNKCVHTKHARLSMHVHGNNLWVIVHRTCMFARVISRNGINNRVTRT